MERFFIRILNVALVVAAFVSLVVVCGAVGILSLYASKAFFSDTSNRHVSIQYQPSNVVSAQAVGSLGAGSPSTSETNSLTAAAQATCNASDELFKFISNNQYGADYTKCVTMHIDVASVRYGDRAENFLTERTAYIKSLLLDPQALAMFNIPAGSDVKASTAKYIDDFETSFEQKFLAAVASDDARKARESAASMDAKATALVLASVSATAFIAFLIIAFLLVAVRVEKHLGNIETKLPVTASRV
jgi:hypothetical protein